MTVLDDEGDDSGPPYPSPSNWTWIVRIVIEHRRTGRKHTLMLEDCDPVTCDQDMQQVEAALPDWRVIAQNIHRKYVMTNDEMAGTLRELQHTKEQR